jgi:hypothetical protein
MEVGKERGKQDAARAKDEAQRRSGNGQTETQPIGSGTTGSSDGPTGARRL